MASKTVKGLTVEINGDTTKLGKALQAVEKQSRSLSSELSDVQKLLRYDSTSVEALTQKKELLTKAVKACADKLEILREAEKQVQAQFKKGDASEEQVRALAREIEATEIKMRDYNKSLDGAYGSLAKLGVETEDVKEATQRMSAEVEASKTTQQKLTEALSGTDTKLKTLGKELGEIDRLLKTNGDSAELNAQRMKVLEDTWNACSEKVYYLKQAEAELEAQFKRGEISGDQLNASLRNVHRQIIECESAMERYGDELRGTTQTQEDFSEEVEETEPHIDRIGDRVNELNERYDKLASQLKDVNAVLKQSPGNVSALAAKKDVLSKAVATATDRLEAMEEAQRQAKRQFEIGAITGEQFDDVRIATSRAEAELEELSDQLRKLGTTGANHMDELEEETEEAGRAAKDAKGGYTVFKDILADICSDVLREFVELMKEATKYILQTGMDFEASMSKVKALLPPMERTKENMADLTELAMEMGAKTKFSAGESADAMTYLAQAGWKTQEILDGLPGVMNLAATDGIDLATAAEICSDALNALGYNAADATTFADALAVVAAASSTNVEELGYAFQYVGPVAGALGYNIDDLSVALGLMANAGLKGEKAGTSLRSLFTNLAKPTDAMATAMEQYGISLTDSNGKMLPFIDVMAQLRNVFGGLTEEQQAALAATLAGKTGMAGLLSIVNAAPEDFYEMMTAIDESNGAAEEMATTMQDNLAGDVEKLGGAFDTLGISITQKFNEPMRQAVQAITGFLEGSVSLPDMLDSLAGSISGIAAKFTEFLPTLGEMGSQLVTYLINGITNGLPNVIDGFMGVVQAIGSYLTEMAPTFLQFGVDLITTLAQGISEFVPQLITTGADIVGSLSQGIQQDTTNFVSKGLDLLDGFADNLTESVPKLIDKGGEFLLNMAKGISQALPEFIARAPEIISKFANVINDNFPKILMKGVQIIWELIKGIIKAIPELIKAIPKIIKAIVDVWEAFNWLSLGKKCIDLIGKGIKSLWGWLKNIGKGTMETVVNILKNLPQNLLNLGKSAASGLGTALRNGWSLVKNGAVTIFNGIVNFFKSLPGKMLQIGIDLVKGLWNGISDMAGWVIDKIMGFGESVLNAIKSFFGIKSPSREFAKIGMYLDQGLAKGILDNADDPLNAAKEMANGVLGTMNDFDGMSVERSIRHGEMRRVLEVNAASDNTMLGKLDKIVSAIERGQVLTIDGKALVGSTAQMYDNRLGQRRALVARGAI